MKSRLAALSTVVLGVSIFAGGCSEADQPHAALRYSEATTVPLPYESGSFVLDLWLEGQTKLQVASAGTGQVDVDIEFEDGDRQDLALWTLVGEVQVRPIHLPGGGSRPARLHFDASPLVRWRGARLLTPVPPPKPLPAHGLAGSLAGRTVVLIAVPEDISESSAMAEMAARGVRFDHCYSQSSWNLPWVTTLFTGLEQELHTVVAEDRSLGSAAVTLAERFQSAEYRTAAFTQVDGLEEPTGVRRGFDEWSSFQSGPTELELMLKDVDRELDDSLDEPRFVFVHFDADTADSGISHLWDHADSIGLDEFLFLLAPMRAPTQAGTRSKVSLLIAAPGSPLAQGRTVTELVSTIDLVPTVIELMGLKVVWPSEHALALTALLQSGVAAAWPKRQLFLSGDYRGSELRQEFVFAGYKYVRTRSDGETTDRLFDLERDPDEQSDLSTNYTVHTGALKRLLTTWWNQSPVAHSLASTDE